MSDEIKIKLKMTPEQIAIFVQDWQTNYHNMLFDEYLHMMIDEVFNDRQGK